MSVFISLPHPNYPKELKIILKHHKKNLKSPNITPKHLESPKNTLI